MKYRIARDSGDVVINISSSSNYGEFIWHERDRWKKSEDRYQKRSIPFNANAFEDEEHVPYHGKAHKRVLTVVTPSVTGPSEVLSFTNEEGELEKYISINPLGEIELVLDEHLNDRKRAVHTMMICGTSTIEICHVHPENKAMSLATYQDEAQWTTVQKTLEANREGLEKTFGKGFCCLVKEVLKSGGKILKNPVELARRAGVSYPHAKQMITEYQKGRQTIVKRLKKLEVIPK